MMEVELGQILTDSDEESVIDDEENKESESPIIHSTADMVDEKKGTSTTPKASRIRSFESKTTTKSVEFVKTVTKAKSDSLVGSKNMPQLERKGSVALRNASWYLDSQAKMDRGDGHDLIWSYRELHANDDMPPTNRIMFEQTILLMFRIFVSVFIVILPSILLSLCSVYFIHRHIFDDWEDRSEASQWLAYEVRWLEYSASCSYYFYVTWVVTEEVELHSNLKRQMLIIICILFIYFNLVAGVDGGDVDNASWRDFPGYIVGFYSVYYAASKIAFCSYKLTEKGKGLRLPSFIEQVLKRNVTLRDIGLMYFPPGFPLLFFQLVSVFLSLSFMLFVMLPLYASRDSSNERFIIAGFLLPLISAAALGVVRNSLHGLKHLHPGRRWLVMSGLVAILAIFNRVMVTQLESITSMTLAALLFGIFEVIGRVTMMRRSVLITSIRKCDCNIDFHTLWQPIQRRVLTDYFLGQTVMEWVGIMTASVSVIYVRLFNTSEDNWSVLGDALLRFIIQAFIEWITDAVSLFLVVRFLDLPVIDVWKRRYPYFLMAQWFVTIAGLVTLPSLLWVVRENLR